MNQHYNRDFRENVNISSSLIENYPSSSATFNYGSIKSTVKEIFQERPEFLNSLKEFSESRARVNEAEIVKNIITTPTNAGIIQKPISFIFSFFTIGYHFY